MKKLYKRRQNEFEKKLKKRKNESKKDRKEEGKTARRKIDSKEKDRQ